MKNTTDNIADPVHAVFGTDAMMFEAQIFHLAIQVADDYLGGSWGFISNDEQTLGFWYPLGQDTFNVSVPSNYYQNSAMPAVAFGAALTLLVVNHASWRAAEQRDEDTAIKLSTLYHQLFSFVFDLSESTPDLMDGSAVAGFID